MADCLYNAREGFTPLTMGVPEVEQIQTAPPLSRREPLPLPHPKIPSTSSTSFLRHEQWNSHPQETRTLVHRSQTQFLPPFLATVLALFLVSVGAFDSLALRIPSLNPQILMDEEEQPQIPVMKASLEMPLLSGTPELIFSTHVVEKGDSLARIALQYDLSPATVVSLNRLEGSALEVGQTLLIPYRDGSRQILASGEYPDDLAQRLGLDVSQVRRIPGSPDVFVTGRGGAVPPAQKDFSYPVAGRILTGFGPGKDGVTGIPFDSDGVDFDVSLGTDVVAAKEGRVIKTGHHPFYGYYVMLSHSGGWRTLYAHLGRVDVAPNDSLKLGEALGLSGSSGGARSPRLRFVLLQGQTPVDPLDYLD